MKCPKCGSTNISTERRPDGDSKCLDCGYSSDTRLFDKAQDIAEIAFNKFINTGADDSDEYWKLFECKDIMNTFVLRAVEYGYKKGYNQAEQDIKLVEQTKWDYVKTFISKMNGWANFRAFLERECK